MRYPPPDSRSKGYGFVSFESQAARSVYLVSNEIAFFVSIFNLFFIICSYDTIY